MRVYEPEQNHQSFGPYPKEDIQLRGFGFAAGCEAAALPRRRSAPYTLGYALGTKIKGQSPDQVDSLRRGRATASHPAGKPNRAWRITFDAKLVR